MCLLIVPYNQYDRNNELDNIIIKDIEDLNVRKYYEDLKKYGISASLSSLIIFDLKSILPDRLELTLAYPIGVFQYPSG